MKYIKYINDQFRNAVGRSNSIVLYGQNISAGSCISGLTKGINGNASCLVINTPNIENTQVGIGFGLMLNGVSSVFFMKQQDFLLLGVDHLVNTYNFVRIDKPLASFTIVTVVVDSGYEGIQSCLNNFSDFCSIARIPGYAVTNKHDADQIIGTYLISPGFRIIGISQRLFQTELIVCEDAVSAYNSGEIFQYYSGKDATIVCFNFSLPQGLKLYNEFVSRGLHASLFSVNAVLPVDWGIIIEDVNRTRKLIVLDDSKSVNCSCYHLTTTIYRECNPERLKIFRRELTDDVLRPNSDEFIVDVDILMQQLK